MKSITVHISDTTYDHIQQHARNSVEGRAAAMLEMAVEDQLKLEKLKDEAAL